MLLEPKPDQTSAEAIHRKSLHSPLRFFVSCAVHSRLGSTIDVSRHDAGHDGGGELGIVGELGQHAFFGERSLLTDQVRRPTGSPLPMMTPLPAQDDGPACVT